MRLRRRDFFTGAAALAAAPGVCVAQAEPLERKAAVRIGWSGAACEAATYVAYEKGFFAREGLAVELVRLSDPLAAPAALASGSIDAVSSLLYMWLKPIQAGLDARLTAGLHGGCVRLVAASGSPIRELGQLKGATVATDRLGGPTMNFFASLLRRRDIDPVDDVRWRAFAPAEFAGALERGEAQAVAAGDPGAHELIRTGRAVGITDDLAAGIFYCDRGISHSHNCYVVMRGDLVRRRPHVAAALTWAWRDATRWVGAHIADAAGVAAGKGYVASSPEAMTAVLATYGWHPAADLAFEEIELTARDFTRADLLDGRTDPEDLAERAYADVLNSR
jgi:NitT/TauT family transport system substrate-binding protein